MITVKTLQLFWDIWVKPVSTYCSNESIELIWIWVSKLYWLTSWIDWVYQSLNQITSRFWSFFVLIDQKTKVMLMLTEHKWLCNMIMFHQSFRMFIMATEPRKSSTMTPASSTSLSIAMIMETSSPGVVDLWRLVCRETNRQIQHSLVCLFLWNTISSQKTLRLKGFNVLHLRNCVANQIRMHHGL